MDVHTDVDSSSLRTDLGLENKKSGSSMLTHSFILVFLQKVKREKDHTLQVALLSIKPVFVDIVTY